MIIVFGSYAAKRWFNDFRETPNNDLDLITTKKEFKDLFFKNYNKIKRVKKIKNKNDKYLVYCGFGKEGTTTIIIEIEIRKQYDLLYKKLIDRCLKEGKEETCKFGGIKFKALIPPPSTLLAIKSNHI